MSLSPLKNRKRSNDETDQGVDEAVEKHGIVKERELFMFCGRAYKPKNLKKAIKLTAKRDDFDVKVVKNGQVVPLSGNTYYVSVGGTFIFKEGNLSVGGIWKPVILTLKGDNSPIHKTYDLGKSYKPISTGESKSIQISLWEQYHGPTTTMEGIADLMLNYSSACDVVVYKVDEDLYNVAFVREKTWICTRCFKEFQTAANWAQHYPGIELPYAKEWHKVHVINKCLVIHPDKFRCGVSEPFEDDDQHSLMDKDVYGTPAKMWKALITGMRTNVTVSRGFLNYWEKFTRNPTWDDVDDLITSRVKETRKQWANEQQRWSENEYKIINPRTKEWGWVKLNYQKQRERQLHIRKIREMDRTIVERQGRQMVYKPPELQTISLDFEIDGNDTISELKEKIYFFRRTPAIDKMCLYIDGEIVWTKLHGKVMRLSDYGVVGKKVGFKIQIRTTKGRFVEPPRMLRDGIKTRKTIAYTQIIHEHKW